MPPCMPPWKLFEHMAIKHFKETHPHAIVKHWEKVPHAMLQESGWLLGNWRKCRLRTGHYAEYGLDGLAFDSKGSFAGIQAKLYGEKSYLGHAKLKTFEKAIENMPSSHTLPHALYLAEGAKLTSSAEELLASRSNLSIVHLSAPQDELISEAPSPAAPEIELSRPHQEEAKCAVLSEYHAAGDEHAVLILAMPSGTGKTHVARCVLDSISAPIVVVVSPLIALAEQNMTRMGGFPLLVWTGRGSCEAAKVRARLEAAVLEANGQPVRIFTTFASCASVTEALGPDAVYDAVVDEAHNLKDDVSELTASAKRVLLLTATPTDAMMRVHEGARIAHQMQMSEAIERTLIANYTLVLPRAIDDAKSLGLDDEAARFRGGDEWALRAFFLVGHMLLEGRKRCIVFARNVEECDLMNATLEQVCARHYGADCWTGKVTHTCGSAERARLLSAFCGDFVQDNPEDRRLELRFLAGVRILDEGIDLPSCDSVFWVHAPSMQDSSLVRVVQQLARCLRAHPGKDEASAVIWARPDDPMLAQTFSRLFEVDKFVGKRVRVLGGAYDALDVPERRKAAGALEETDLAEFKQRFELGGAGARDAAFAKFYSALCSFREEYGHARVPERYVMGEYRLGVRVRDVRSKGIFLRGPNAALRRGMLDALGFVWNTYDEAWRNFVVHLEAFVRQTGDAGVPRSYISTAVAGEKPYALGKAVNKVRQGRMLERRADEAARRAELDAHGFVWDARRKKH